MGSGAILVFASLFGARLLNSHSAAKSATPGSALVGISARAFSKPALAHADPVTVSRKAYARTVPVPGSVHVPILMYHHVGTLPPEGGDGLRRDLTVSPENFEAEVAWLAKTGYSAVTLADVFLAASHEKVLPKKPVVFTFDDGYSDAIRIAVPILAKYGFVGSFAVVTQFPGTTNGSNTYATWDEIRAAKDSGMEIVSHTQNHFDGTSAKFNDQYVFDNLSGSRADLARELGSASDILVYPYGHFSQAYITEAKKAGFVMALTTAFGEWVNPENLMEVPRVRVHGQEPLDRFIEILTGVKTNKPPGMAAAR